jgi:uncharacterized protein (DUF1499 family)
MTKTLAALAALAALTAPGAFAAVSTSEEQKGTYSMPYACSVQSTDLALSPVGSSTSSVSNTAPFTYSQNDDTVYTLSPLSFVAPRDEENALSGLIRIRKGNGGTVISQGSEVTPAIATLEAIQGETGSIQINLNTAKAVFRAGDYEVKSTLSCAQAP